MENILAKIKALIINKQDILLEQLNFGACTASISVFKSKLEIDLPDIFYEFYELFNGSVSASATIWASMSLLPLSQIISEKKLMDKLTNEGKFDNWEKGNWWNKNWVPFLSDKSNCMVCIDTKGSFAGVEGQVIVWRNDAPERTILFESFAHWLEALYHLINNFEKDIAMNRELYHDYCVIEIEKLAKQMNNDYPKVVNATRTMT